MTRPSESRQEMGHLLNTVAKLIVQGRLADAEAILARVAAVQNADWTVPHNRALVLRRMGKMVEARDLALRAMALNPNSTEPYTLLAETAVEQRDGNAAIGPLTRLTQLLPENWEAQHNLGATLRQSGKPGPAMRVLSRAAFHPEAPWDSPYLLATLLIETGNGASAIKPMVRAITLNPKMLERKRLFYQLRSIFESAKGQIGTAKALALARSLFRDIRPFILPADLLSGRSETRRALIAATGRPPASRYDVGIGHLVGGRPEEAIQAYIQSIQLGDPPATKYDLVIDEGPDRGHPIWHAMNPFFYIWMNGRIEQPSAVQNNWRTNPAVGTARQASAQFKLPRDWETDRHPLRSGLARFLESRAPTLRVLDVGCGDGSWLAFMADYCRLPATHLMGTDLHQRRVDDTREVLMDVAKKQGMTASAARDLIQKSVFQCDALTWDTGAFAASQSPIDLISLFSVTACFSDTQLDDLLNRLARIRARWIFESNAVSTWDMNIGRHDASPIYRRHGYRLIERYYLGEPLNEELSPYLVLPRKYWSARQYNVYERID